MTLPHLLYIWKRVNDPQLYTAYHYLYLCVYIYVACALYVAVCNTGGRLHVHKNALYDIMYIIIPSNCFFILHAIHVECGGWM